jgi:hypothetical protein
MTGNGGRKAGEARDKAGTSREMIRKKRGDKTIVHICSVQRALRIFILFLF